MRGFPMCYYCEHVRRDNDKRIQVETCDAYPNGIPEAVLEAGHKFPKPNDNGIQFKGSYPFPDEINEITEEDEDKSYDEEVMTDEEYFAKYGREKPMVI